MKFLVEDLIERKDCYSWYPIKKNHTLPSVADAYRKAYYSRPKLTLKERWNMFWSNPCYPLRTH